MRPALDHCLAALCALVGPALASPWPQPAGGVWIQSGYGFFRGDERAAVDEVVDSPPVRFTGHAAELYADVGLGQGFGLQAQLRYARNDQGDDSVVGWSDMELTGSWTWLGRSVVALRGGVRVAPYATANLGERATGAATLGPGGVDLLSGAGFGRPIGAGWLAVELLHRLRLGGASSGLRLTGELGGPLLTGLALAATLEFQPAFGTELDQPDDAPAPVDQRFALGGKVLLDVLAGFKVVADSAWFPPAGNDGPGVRVGAALAWQGAP